MKRLTVIIAVASLCLFSCKKETVKTDGTNDTIVPADTATAIPPQQPMDSIAIQKAWEEYSTPGFLNGYAVHRLLWWNSSCCIGRNYGTNDTIVPADTATAIPPQQPMDSIAIQKAWEEYSTPGDVHKLLASEVGKWDVTMTFWMEPGAQPQSDKASAEVKMVMGGRYQKTVFTGNMMGMAWEGESTVAYNNKSKEITSTFIDNSGTGIMVSTGPYDAAKKAFDLKGESVDPMTGKTIKFREVYTFVDDNTRKLEIFDTKEGQSEYKSLEIMMKRK